MDFSAANNNTQNINSNHSPSSSQFDSAVSQEQNNLDHIPLAKTYDNIEGIEGKDYILLGEDEEFNDDDISYEQTYNQPSSSSSSMQKDYADGEIIRDEDLSKFKLATTYSEVPNSDLSSGYFEVDENGNETFVEGVSVPESKPIATSNKDVSNSETEDKSFFENIKTRISLGGTTDKDSKITASIKADVSDNTNVSLNYEGSDASWEKEGDTTHNINFKTNTSVTDNFSLNNEIGTDINEKGDAASYMSVGGKWAGDDGASIKSSVKFTENSNPVLNAGVSQDFDNGVTTGVNAEFTDGSSPLYTANASWSNDNGLKTSASGNTEGELNFDASSKTDISDDASVTLSASFKDDNRFVNNNEEYSTSIDGDYSFNDKWSANSGLSLVRNTETDQTNTYVDSSVTYKADNGLSTKFKVENDANNDFKASSSFSWEF